jgi:hypothetical protein
MAYKRSTATRRCLQAPEIADGNRLVRANLSAATTMWGPLSKLSQARLKIMSRTHLLNVAAGELCLLDGRWYVTHAGLLRIAEHR